MIKYETVDELLIAPENEHYEFKEAKNRYDLQEALKYCCALANCGGGKLVLGISDSRPRKVVGSSAFEQPERTREVIMEKLRIQVYFNIYTYTGKRVLVFSVAGRPVGLPVQVDGRYWYRKGDSLVYMPSEKLRSIFAEGGHDFSSDICMDAVINDLDVNAIEVFRQKWTEKSGNARIKSLSVKQLLTDCEAMVDKELTYAALILFGTHEALGKFLPQNEVIFEYRASNASGPAQHREEFRLGFFAFHERIWELINLRNEKQHYQDGLFVFDIPTFNERVIREALLNAISHRNYQMNGSVFIRQYNDRLTIESPGGFPMGVTLDNILDRQSPRNRRVAQILALCGLVERSGQGMNLMYELSIKEAKPLPNFHGTDDFLVNLTLNGLVLDNRMLSLINKIGNERMESLSTNDFLLISTLYHDNNFPDDFLPNVSKLMDMGIIERTGRNKYVLARSLYAATGKSGVHTRRIGLDQETNKEMIILHLKKSGSHGAPFKEFFQVLPSLSRSQIQILLRKLMAERRIILKGKNKGARWFLLI